MTLTISKYKLSKQQHTITLDYTLGENENLFTDLHAYDLQEFFSRIEMRFVKQETWGGRGGGAVTVLPEKNTQCPNV